MNDPIVVKDKNGNFYAKTYSTYDSRLISAAPDLLEACEAVKNANSHIETCDMPEWLDLVEQAIAKAKGDPLTTDNPYTPGWHTGKKGKWYGSKIQKPAR